MLFILVIHGALVNIRLVEDILQHHNQISFAQNAWRSPARIQTPSGTNVWSKETTPERGRR
eukprot:14468872-Heterocapsa_arctica.AAC.1